ncbi:TonB-dependent receptor domain-containing protein [Kordiimonas sp. SCSIO 12610]|uniref:TonB-dependent receptor domain-containing protein n=1 Tax=Kordiimonas sp. SCSIO 12610 TaxID=2829597 RepID=UPI00210F1D44|nr:TonB-dependent receptor [Kordiimonas sp. SCSIO 12610]UTW54504.1 TonB-dependent receptor [Kordiimonas sp. SCSIO 12610]
MNSLELWKSRFRFGTASTLLAVLGVVGSSNVYAQDTSTDDEEVEEVVVTGSRIRRSSENASVPLKITGAVEIENRGFTNVIQALNDDPAFFGNNSAVDNPNAGNQNGDAFAFPNVLGLGTQRTLSLFNGRRFVATNQNTVFVPGNFTGAQVDLSIINPALLERTETTIGSGGAVYGADAVAGVVNLITKDDFEGLDVTTQFGISDRGDGETYRASVAYGQNFDDDRGNFAVSLEYSDTARLDGSDRSFTSINRAEITNPLNGRTRNLDPFSTQAAISTLLGGGTLAPAFNPAGADGIQSTRSVIGIVNPTISFGGVLAGGTGGFSGIQPILNLGPVPGALAGAGADPAGFAFFAPSSLPAGVDPAAVIASLSPGAAIDGLNAGQLNSLALGLLQRNRPTVGEFFNSNPGLNPNLFLGTFADSDAFPTIANTDPATSAIFPRIAVPLQFASNGNLVPLNIGQRIPGVTDINSVIGGDGLAFNGTTTPLVAGQERYNIFTTGHYDLTDNVTVFADFLYSRTEFDLVAQPASNTQFNGTSGQGGIRIFIDENPFVNQQALDTLNDLEAQGFNIATQDGSRFITVSRNTADFFEDRVNINSTETDTFRGTIGFKGDFDAFDRNFFWETSFVYGRSETTNTTDQRRDIELFLALDVVTDENGNTVCRQQTLDAPESIAVRNPGLGGIANNLGLTPTQAQIDACIPLNILGDGAPSQAALDLITFRATSENVTEQYFYSAQFGGDIVELPGGTAGFNTQFEYRRESNQLTPSFEVENGLGNNANTPPAQGTTEFVEWGIEASIPVFGGDFTLPGIKSLEFDGAYRIVNRTQSSETELFQDIIDDVSGVTDSIFQVVGRWRPIDDLLVTANYSESVRSPSQTELFGSLQFAFANGNGAFPCTSTTINQGPNPSVRAQNCAALFGALGLPANFGDTFQNINVGETAGVVGNPFLSNEQSDSYSVGIAYTPSWLPGSYFQANYVAIDIENQVGLNGPATSLPACFDSSDFPNVDVNGTNVCNQFIFGADDGTGTFIVPSDGISQITGEPVLVGPAAGQPLNAQGPAQVAFSFFSNLNLASTELRQLNFRAGYTFSLEDAIGYDWGQISIRGDLNYIDRFDSFPTGSVESLNPQAGDVNPNWRGRFDFDYSIGKFGALVQLFHTSGTVGNILTPQDAFPEQQNDFVLPAFNRFNLNLRYQLTENVTIRGIVNNVFDNNGTFGRVENNEFFIQRDPIGRTYNVTVSARF